MLYGSVCGVFLLHAVRESLLHVNRASFSGESLLRLNCASFSGESLLHLNHANFSGESLLHLNHANFSGESLLKLNRTNFSGESLLKLNRASFSGESLLHLSRDRFSGESLLHINPFHRIIDTEAHTWLISLVTKWPGTSGHKTSKTHANIQVGSGTGNNMRECSEQTLPYASCNKLHNALELFADITVCIEHIFSRVG